MTCKICGYEKGETMKNGKVYYYCGACNRKHQKERAIKEREMLKTHVCKCKGKLYETAKIFNADRRHDFLLFKTETFMKYQSEVGAI